MTVDSALVDLAREVLDKARAQKLKIATAESCTGGLVAMLLTEIAGSSDVFERGFVTYSNEAKADMLGVWPGLIAEHGAVSEPVARAMAEGAVKQSRADAAVAITGIAGPGGGTKNKPVGLVHIAVYRKGSGTRHGVFHFGGLGRRDIRERAARDALMMLMVALA
ncbi:MAG: CinA family protein [Beijerinckiaceae bacterium]